MSHRIQALVVASSLAVTGFEAVEQGERRVVFAADDGTRLTFTGERAGFALTIERAGAAAEHHELRLEI